MFLLRHNTHCPSIKCMLLLLLRLNTCKILQGVLNCQNFLFFCQQLSFVRRWTAQLYYTYTYQL